MPFLAGLILASLSLIYVIQVLVGEASIFWEIKVKWAKALSAVGAMLAYGFLLNKIGFVFTTFLFVAFLMKFTVHQTWRKAVVGGAISSLASYLLFETFLKSQLPRTSLRFF